jgi:TRAP-type transport system small permease protein
MENLALGAPLPAAPQPVDWRKLSWWRRITAAYAKLLEVLLVACVGILIIPVSLQVISRYTPFIPSYIWTEEMARFLFIWTIMIGAMIGVRDAQHFEVDVWPELSRRPEAAVRIVARLGILALALVFVWCGIEFTKFAMKRTSELADLPLWLIHIAWPVAGFTWIAFAGEQIIDELRILFGGKAHGAASGGQTQ